MRLIQLSDGDWAVPESTDEARDLSVKFSELATAMVHSKTLLAVKLSQRVVIETSKGADNGE